MQLLCDTNVANSCRLLNRAGRKTFYNALLVANGRIYAGVQLMCQRCAALHASAVHAAQCHAALGTPLPLAIISSHSPPTA